MTPRTTRVITKTPAITTPTMRPTLSSLSSKPLYFVIMA